MLLPPSGRSHFTPVQSIRVSFLNRELNWLSTFPTNIKTAWQPSNLRRRNRIIGNPLCSLNSVMKYLNFLKFCTLIGPSSSEKHEVNQSKSLFIFYMCSLTMKLKKICSWEMSLVLSNTTDICCFHFIPKDANFLIISSVQCPMRSCGDSLYLPFKMFA